jgi:hypothetical protein
MSTSSPCCDPRDIYPSGFPSNFDTSGFTVGTGLMLTNSSTYGTNINLDLSSNEEFRSLADRITKIEEMLCILKPDLEMNEKYESLRQAYESYQIILKLVREQNAKIHG